MSAQRRKGVARRAGGQFGTGEGASGEGGRDPAIARTEVGHAGVLQGEGEGNGSKL